MGFREEYGPLLEAIADEADAIAMRYFRADELRVERKGDGSAVTQADRAVEEMARAKVVASGLALDVLGEEMGGRDAKAANASERARLIIDPIDGTEEFSRGIPTFGTLLGIEEKGEVVAGMASAPALGSRWWAYRGQGAYRDGKAIHVSSVARLGDAMIFTTGTSTKKNAAQRESLRRLADAARNGRAIGGFWQHMLVAEGAVDVAVDLTSMPWDLAPLLLIVEEAGGVSTNLQGQRNIYTGALVSTNGKFHGEVLQILK
ncbi:MAG TPA: inositol monophosphatase family protein [Candidatus Dormibacteraeota bacterium]|nr:inositol monophosphatase family protein [Candidatus Dormibacteraeota bacterium]